MFTGTGRLTITTPGGTLGSAPGCGSPRALRQTLRADRLTHSRALHGTLMSSSSLPLREIKA